MVSQASYDIADYIDSLPVYAQNAIRSIQKKTPSITTIGQILVLSQAELNAATQLDLGSVSKFMRVLSSVVFQHVTMQDAYALAVEPYYKASWGDPVFDDMTRGGIPTQGITEIAGEAASAKTQLCLQLMLQSQIPHPASITAPPPAVLYLCTEGDVPIKRLRQMADYYKENAKSIIAQYIQQNGHDDGIVRPDAEDLCRYLYVEKVDNLDSMWNILFTRISSLLQSEHPLRLIIIDSIAALFRSEFTKDDVIARTKVLWEYANQLKFIADKYKVAVVVVNQVTDVVAKEGNEFNSNGAQPHMGRFVKPTAVSRTAGSTTTPALGLAWANFVNTRIILSRTSRSLGSKKRKLQDGTNEIEPENVIRRMRVVLSPFVAESECLFVVDNSGVHAVDQNAPL